MSKKKYRAWKQKWNEYYSERSIERQLRIGALAYEKLYHYVRNTKGEISGFGKISHTKNEDRWAQEEIYTLEDVRIFKQECSDAGTTIGGEMLATFISDLIKKKEDPFNWRLWWHSHNDFGVSWSGIDEQAIGKLIRQENAELLSVCMNKKANIIGRRDTDKETDQFLKISIMPFIHAGMESKCIAEIKDKVRAQKNTFKYVPAHTTPNQPRLALPAPSAYESNYMKIFKESKRREWAGVTLRFNPDTGLYIRIADGQGFTAKEVGAGLHRSFAHA